jgi:hypothetical protein
VVRGRFADSNRSGARCAPLRQITEPLRPATSLVRQARQGSNPDRRGWSSPCCRLHHGPTKQTARIERASPEWRSDALPAELRLRRSLRQESNPHLGRTKGACLPLTLRRRMETAGVEPAPPRCKRGALPQELHPQGANGWSRTITARGNAFTARRAHQCSAFARQRVTDRIRTGATRFTTSGACRYTTVTTNGDDRTRTGGLSPDKRALCSSELRPLTGSAGGIRTHGLELMRLAGTASPLPRRSGRQESNLRSPVPETGGVARLPYSQMKSTPGGARTRSFRVETPASSPVRPRGRELRRQGSNLRLAVNSRASCRSTTPERAEGEGVEPPRPGGPPVFETGYRACGSPSR